MNLMNKDVYEKGLRFFYSKTRVIIGFTADVILLAMFIPFLIKSLEKKQTLLIVGDIMFLCLAVIGMITNIRRAKHLKPGNNAKTTSSEGIQ